MKLLVLSNVSGSVDRVVDLIQQNHNVIAKEIVGAATNTIVQTVSSQMGNGSYDQAIVVAKDPIGACMLLNKKEGIEAAVCDSIEDVQLAKQNGANVIVIRDVHSDELHDIVQQIVGYEGVLSKIKGGVKIPQMLPKMPKKEMPMDQEAPQDKKTKIRQPSKTKKVLEEEEEAPAEEGQTGESGKGDIVSKLKDYLGIT